MNLSDFMARGVARTHRPDLFGSDKVSYGTLTDIPANVSSVRMSTEEMAGIALGTRFVTISVAKSNATEAPIKKSTIQARGKRWRIDDIDEDASTWLITASADKN